MEKTLEYYTDGLEKTNARIKAIKTLVMEAGINERLQKEFAYCKELKKYLTKKIHSFSVKKVTDEDFDELI